MARQRKGLIGTMNRFWDIVPGYMESDQLQQFAADVKTIITSKYYKGRICHSDLVNELRQRFIVANVDLGHQWSLSIWFINGDLEDLMAKLGYEVVYEGPVGRHRRYYVLGPVDGLISIGGM